MAYHKKRRRGQQALYIAKTCGTSHNGIIYEKKIIIPRKANLIHEKKKEEEEMQLTTDVKLRAHGGIRTNAILRAGCLSN